MLYPYTAYTAPSPTFNQAMQPRLLYPNSLGAPYGLPSAATQPMVRPTIPSQIPFPDQPAVPAEQQPPAPWHSQQQKLWIALGLGGIALLGGGYWLMNRTNSVQQASMPAAAEAPASPNPAPMPVGPHAPASPDPAPPPVRPHAQLHPLQSPKSGLMKLLFPPVLSDCNFQQGHIGDCTFLASLKATLHNNPDKIRELFEPAEDGKVAITFKDADTPQRLALNDVKTIGVKGALGVKLLETAFGRHIKPRFCNAYDTIVALDEGGYADKAIKALTNGKTPRMIFNDGKPLGSSPKSLELSRDALREIEANPAQRIAVASACKKLPRKDIMAAHAYAVLHVNTGSNKITLANPHNTVIPITLSFDEFFKHFRRLVFAKV